MSKNHNPRRTWLGASLIALAGSFLVIVPNSARVVSVVTPQGKGGEVIAKPTPAKSPSRKTATSGKTSSSRKPPSEPVVNLGLVRTITLQMPPNDKFACNDITKTVRLQGFIDKNGKLVNWTPDRGCPTHLDLLEKDLENQRFTPATVKGRYVKSGAYVDYVFTDNPIGKPSGNSAPTSPANTGKANSSTLPHTRTNQTGIEFVLIPPGSFTMGSTNGYADEKPVHQVTIGYSFYMGKYEVTQAQWQSVMGNNPSNFNGDNLPAETVSWLDAQQFLQKLNQMNDGYTYRLPTEVEWEYAARAGTTTNYYWGEDKTQACRYANVPDQTAKAKHAGWDIVECRDGYAETSPVGSFTPNAWGLFDITGNGWEWCEDWYHPSYEGAPNDGSAWLSGGEQKYRVVRGGSWYLDATHLRSALRLRHAPDHRDWDLGFRVVAVVRTQ